MKKLLSTLALKISAILWIIWGFVHIFAGAITISKINSGDIAGAISGIADAVDPTTLVGEYPVALGALLGQHGFNLIWIGLVTFICAFFVWKKQTWAIFLAALVGGLADVGYFLFMDLGGYVNFIPGTVMTIISGSAIVLSFWAWYGRKESKFNNKNN
jgi:hypothetical protein